MGKKKKSIDSGTRSTTTPSSAKNNNEHGRQAALSISPTTTPTTPQTEKEVVVDALHLQLIIDPSKSSSPSSRQKLQQQPTVLLSLQDARKLDVLPNEDVILLHVSSSPFSTASSSKATRRTSSSNDDDVHDKNDQTTPSPPSIVGAAWCKALVSNPATTESKKQVPLGRVKVLPPSIVNLLLLGTTKTTSTTLSLSPTAGSSTFLSTTATTTTTTTTTPSNNSNTNFSFKIGGGGDQLYSPSSSSYSTTASPPASAKALSSAFSTPTNKDYKQQTTTISSTRHTTNTNNTIMLWVVPVLSDLGRRILQPKFKLCRRARVLHLEQLPPPRTDPGTTTATTSILDTGTTASTSRSSNHHDKNSSAVLLKRVLLAHVIGRWVQSGEEFHHVTFQGKALPVRVVGVEEEQEEEESQDDDESHDEEDSSVLCLDKSMAALSVEERTAAAKTTTPASCAIPDGKREGAGTRWFEEAFFNKSGCTTTCTNTVRLFQVTRSTRIELVTAKEPQFEPHDDKKNGATSTTSTTTPRKKKNKPHQQYVAGLDSVLEQLRTFFTAPPLFLPPNSESKNRNNNFLIKAPRGILLHGPSGVGKSSLAKQLVSELRSSSSLSLEQEDERNDHRFFFEEVEYVNCTSLQSQTAVVGQAERQLSRLFAIRSSTTATPFSRSKKGSGGNNGGGGRDKKKLLVLDDVHLICPKRGGNNTDRLAATLLSLMDGVEEEDDSGCSEEQPTIIYVLAITSNPSLLDPALRRPGRIDAEIEVPLPDDAPTRAEILKFQVQQCCLGDGGDDAHPHPQLPHHIISQDEWLDLAKLAKGFNGADCMLAVKEALRHSIFADTEQQQRGVAAATTVTRTTTNAGATVQNKIQSFSPSQSRSILTFDDLKAGIRATKPSAIKSITVEIPHVLWSSIGGMESVKKELREAIELPLSSSSSSSHDGELWLDRLKVPPPRGILLYGPPGCSKTLMARALATQGHYNFLAVKGPELLSKWLGESERALASLFRRASMASPAIIFFDEMDAIACKRGSGDSASSNRLLSQLLTELDGVNHPTPTTSSDKTGNKKHRNHPRVVVIGATNRPDLLDPALTRPGRMDRRIYVGVPDTESRAQIFRISLHGRECGKDVDVGYLAREEVSGGYSGAEIVAVCRDSALVALEEADEDELNDSHAAYGAATARVTSGVRIEQRHLLRAISGMKRQITPKMIAFYDSYRETSSDRLAGTTPATST